VERKSDPFLGKKPGGPGGENQEVARTWGGPGGQKGRCLWRRETTVERNRVGATHSEDRGEERGGAPGGGSQSRSGRQTKTEGQSKRERQERRQTGQHRRRMTGIHPKEKKKTLAVALGSFQRLPQPIPRKTKKKRGDTRKAKSRTNNTQLISDS